MSKFTAFMAKNAVAIENKKVIISKRFVDENGQPIEWELKAISAEENEELQRKCMVNVPVAGRRGQTTREIDQFKFTNALLAASVVYPDLLDAELQDSYGVKTPEALLKKMLLPREEAKLAQEVANLSEIEDFTDLSEEAKN